MDPILGTKLKAGIAFFGRLIFPFFRRQAARRGAEQGLPTSLLEVEEALDVLAGGVGLAGQTFAGSKGWMSDAPPTFKEDRFQRWVSDPVVRGILRQAAIRRWQGLGVIEAEKAEALRIYEAISSDARQRAMRPFDDAVTFLVLSIRATQTPSERIGDEKGNADRDVIVGAVEAQGERLEATINKVLDGNLSRQIRVSPNAANRTRDELIDASGELLSWPGDIAGRVMERPELNELERRLTAPITTNFGRTILLFGPPGSGKSALLAAIGNRFRESGATVLGIKADALPISVSTLSDLGPALDLGSDIVAEIAAQTSRGPVYILIDQLDAVASLIDGSGGRLRALNTLARRLRGWPEVRVAASVRLFEFVADGGFRAAFPEHAIERMDLSLPKREAVDELLCAVGIDPAEIPVALDEVVRIPQALRDIVGARRAGFAWGAMTTWRATQALRFDRLVAAHPELGIDRLIQHMVASLRGSGTLWSASSSLPLGSAQAIDRLCAEGILRRRDESGLVGFAHQTWAETLDARLALANGELAERVVEAGRNLLARPQALAVLRYARDAAPNDYDAAITILWRRQDLRRHLRHLIIDLAAGSDAPTQAERRIVTSTIAGNDNALVERALRLSAGKPAWINALLASISERMADTDELRAQSVWLWLSSATASHSQIVLDLLDRYWSKHPNLVRLTPHVLENLTLWDERAFSLFKVALQKSGRVNHFAVSTMRKQAAAGRHEIAAQLVGLIFERVIILTDQTIDKSNGKTSDEAEPEIDDFAAVIRRLHTERQRSFSYQLAKGLRELHGLHDFPEFMRQCPKPYVDVLLPRFAVLASSGLDEMDEEGLHGLESAHRQASRYDLPIVEGLRVGLEELCRTSPAAFEKAVFSVRPGIQLLDRLFALAFTSNIHAIPAAALAFLEADCSRLRLGDRFGDDQSETFDLIKALSFQLSQAENDRLFRLIMSWNEYEVGQGDGVEQRRVFRVGNRRLRARLLSGIDIDRVSQGSRKIILEELRAVPDVRRERILSRGGWVRSPMSTEAMELASDQHILDLFQKLPDGTERWRSDPSNFLVGGSQEASNALSELAKRQPERVFNLLTCFSPLTHQTPVGSALRTLSEITSIEANRFLSLLDEMLDLGFGNKGFRRDVTLALHNLAERSPGLDNRWVALLISWLEIPDRASLPFDSINAPAHSSSERPLPITVLFDNRRMRLHSGGDNSAILGACSLALLRREEPAYEQWLCLLEDHLARPEDSAVWVDFSIWLTYLSRTDPARASIFVAELMKQYPELRDSDDGARLVARLLRVLPPSIVDDIVDAWGVSDWPLASISIGELKGLRAVLFEPSLNPNAWPEIAAAEAVPSDVLAGVANVAVAFWDDDDAYRRSWGRRTLAFLAEIPEARVAQACADFFRRVVPWQPDSDTRQMLRIFAGNHVGLHQASNSLTDDRLSEIIEDPLSHEPILDFVEASINLFDQSLADHSGIGPMLARGYMPLILTLHREAQLRDRTLNLFDNMIDIVPNEVEGVLNELQ